MANVTSWDTIKHQYEQGCYCSTPLKWQVRKELYSEALVIIVWKQYPKHKYSIKATVPTNLSLRSQKPEKRTAPPTVFVTGWYTPAFPHLCMQVLSNHLGCYVSSLAPIFRTTQKRGQSKLLGPSPKKMWIQSSAMLDLPVICKVVLTTVIGAQSNGTRLHE